MKQIPFGPDIKGSWDTIEFANSEDPGKVALQVDVHFVKSGNGIRLLELRNTTQGIDDPNSWHTNPGSSKMFNGPKGNFTIQIWEDEDTKSCLIIIFSQSPNSALSKFHTTFRYYSTWLRVSDANIILFNREVSSMMMDRMLKIDKISQCRFPIPVPCNQQPELIHVDLRLPYTLSCKISGVDYLSYKWRKADTELALSTAELVIPACSVDDLGPYTCQVFGENYGKIAEKTFSLQYSKEINVLSKDLERNAIIWVEGWPLDEVELRCTTEAGEVLPVYRGNVSRDTTPPRIKLTATNPKNASDINCDVMNRSTKLSYDSFKFNCRKGQSQLLNGECFKPVPKGFQTSTYILSVFVVVLLFLAFFMHQHGLKDGHWMKLNFGAQLRQGKFFLYLKDLITMDKIRSLINTHQQRSTDSIEDEPILLEKNISTKKDWEDHKDDPVEREEVMKSIDKILFSGDIDPSFKLLQELPEKETDLIALEETRRQMRF